MFQHGGSFIQEMLKQHLHLPGSGDTITTTHSAPKILSPDAKTICTQALEAAQSPDPGSAIHSALHSLFK